MSDVLNSNGDVQLTYAYTQFGKTTTFFSEYVDNPYRYNAECVDYVPGIPDFQYLRARYYAPHEGRFIQQDTLFGDVMVPLSQNLYAYAMNNPLSFIDPSGHYNIPLSIEMAGAYAVEMYLIKTGQKVPADKKIIQAEITNLEQVYNRASLSEKDAIKATLDAKKEELDGNGGLYSIVGIDKISREFNAVYDPNMQIQGTANGTAQPQMITVGEKEKWGWASKDVGKDIGDGVIKTLKSALTIFKGAKLEAELGYGLGGGIEFGDIAKVDAIAKFNPYSITIGNDELFYGETAEASLGAEFLIYDGTLGFNATHDLNADGCICDTLENKISVQIQNCPVWKQTSNNNVESKLSFGVDGYFIYGGSASIEYNFSYVVNEINRIWSEKRE